VYKSELTAHRKGETRGQSHLTLLLMVRDYFTTLLVRNEFYLARNLERTLRVSRQQSFMRLLPELLVFQRELVVAHLYWSSDNKLLYLAVARLSNQPHLVLKDGEIHHLLPT
jgi:hypothetical protein